MTLKSFADTMASMGYQTVSLHQHAGHYWISAWHEGYRAAPHKSPDAYEDGIDLEDAATRLIEACRLHHQAMLETT